ncbi:SUN domain-containing ossification factor-like isoform X1 [Argonauta hians]
MGTETQIAKFCLLLCLTCTFWHSLTNASEPLKARTRQVEAKSENTHGTEKKPPDHVSGHNVHTEATENPQEQNTVSSQNKPTDPENKNGESPEKEMEKIIEMKTDQSKETLEHSISEHSTRGAPVVEAMPSKVSTEPASSESTLPASKVEPVVDTAKPTEETEIKPEEPQPPKIDETPGETAENGEPLVESSDPASVADNTENKESVEKTTEDFPIYSEWTKKVLAEEKNKQNDQGLTSSSLPQKQKMRNNYASSDCGAKVVLANPEAENVKYILNSNPDEYMINPCQSRKWFIIELCESIQIKNIETASLELFSSRPKTFRISVSDRYPSKEWQILGTFESTEERNIHKYQITEENYSKFVKVDILDHYGKEHFCPLTLFRVFGFTIEEDMETDVTPHEDLDDDVQDEPPVNLFASAKDTVLRLVKSVLTPGNEEEAKENADSSQTEGGQTNATSQKTVVKTPNVTIPCQEKYLNGTQNNKTANGTLKPCVPEATINSTATKSIEPSLASDQLEPTVPEASINIVPESSLPYRNETLVTILKDDEQVPISDSTSEPMVQFIEHEENPAVLSSYITSCLVCPVKQDSDIHSSHHSLKCHFLYRVSLATSNKKDSVSWKVPVDSKIEDLSTSYISETGLYTENESDQNIVTLETDTSESQSTKAENITVPEKTASLYSSSEVHTVLESAQTVTKVEKSEESSVDSEIVSQMETSTSESSASKLASDKENKTSSLGSDIPSVEQKTASSKFSSSAGETVDFRTPATTIYIEPSSTSLKQIELNGIASSEHYDSHLSPSDPLITKSVSTTSSLIDNNKDVVSEVKSDEKANVKESESNIITTASLPKNGEEMEAAGPSIVPTRVSESPSKNVVQNSSSIAASSMSAEDRVVKAVNVTEPKVDSKGRPLYTLVRVGLPPAGKRESAIMRLNNRIKALELNVSLSSRFLDELSQRYRKQSEEMMHFLNKTVARLGNVTKRTEETVQKHEIHLTILESRLDNLTQAVNQLTENMDTLTRQLTDRQVLWASVEVVILALIFVVCLRKRQPSLSPNLVAKVLDDLLQTQHFSPNRRRNSESSVKLPSITHSEVVRQKSADDLTNSKAVHIVEPTTPFLLGQVKEGNKKRKKKKNRSVDLKLATCKEGLPKEKSVSTTQLNSAGLLFMGKPVDTGSSSATQLVHYKKIKECLQELSGASVGSVYSSNGSCSKTSSNHTGLNGAARGKDCSSRDTNIHISCSKSDPDLYTVEDSVSLSESSKHFSCDSTSMFAPTLTSLSLPSTSKAPPMCSIPKSFSSSLPTSMAAMSPPVEQNLNKNIFHRTNLIPYSTKQLASLSAPSVVGSSGPRLVQTTTATAGANSAAFKNRFKSLDVGQKNSSERKNINRCRTQVPCDGFRKF